MKLSEIKSVIAQAILEAKETGLPKSGNKLVELKKPVKIDPNDTKKLPTLESDLGTDTTTTNNNDYTNNVQRFGLQA
jgi:hypothetical protein